MMNMYDELKRRQVEGRPVRVGVIGAGKFVTMFLSQARNTAGLHVVALTDLSTSRARHALETAGWRPETFGAQSLDNAASNGTTFITDDTEAVLRSELVDVVVEATGNPIAGVRHARLAIEHGRHVVMVNVEADALAGPKLAEFARSAGVVYTLAYGDQPALICELVDWARTAGFEIACAGKGAKFHPDFTELTPDGVWEHFPWFTEEQIAGGEVNAQRFTSFVDGTKSSLELAVVCNATGLRPPTDGLSFPPAGEDEIAEICRPREDGGTLDMFGTVEAISDLNRDKSYVDRNLHYGVWVTFRSANPYSTQCFPEYGIRTDATGRYAQLFRPNHLIGLELGVSIAAAALHGQATGTSTEFRGDVVAVAKRDLAVGDVLDGEGGYAAWGKLIPATTSTEKDILPIGLADKVTIRRPIPKGEFIRWADVDIDMSNDVVQLRRSMEPVSNSEANYPPLDLDEPQPPGSRSASRSEHRP